MSLFFSLNFVTQICPIRVILRTFTQHYMCLGYTAKSRDCQYCVIVIAFCPSYCDIVLFLFVLLLFAGLLVAKTGLRRIIGSIAQTGNYQSTLVDSEKRDSLFCNFWDSENKFQNPLVIKRDPLPKKLHTLLKSLILDYNEGWSERSKN